MLVFQITSELTITPIERREEPAPEVIAHDRCGTSGSVGNIGIQCLRATARQVTRKPVLLEIREFVALAAKDTSSLLELGPACVRIRVRILRTALHLSANTIAPFEPFGDGCKGSSDLVFARSAHFSTGPTCTSPRIALSLQGMKSVNETTRG